jgi:uncharacterized metal-binding protein
MAAAISKVGIIACSGEEIAEGTVARQAVRRVLEALRPQQTVTLCLPLFLAGEEGERRFAREHPTITVDGCSKLCAKRGTEKYSSQVRAALVVGDILGDRAKGCHRSTREADKADEEAVWLVAERIAAEVDALAGSEVQGEADDSSAAGAACCSCGSPPPEITLEIGGKSVAVNGLPLIFEHLQEKGLRPDSGCSATLLETVKIYHAIEPAEEAAYREALAAGYLKYCQRQSADGVAPSSQSNSR